MLVLVLEVALMSLLTGKGQAHRMEVPIRAEVLVTVLQIESQALSRTSTIPHRTSATCLQVDTQTEVETNSDLLL
jgi:hypothetical protein